MRLVFFGDCHMGVVGSSYASDHRENSLSHTGVGSIVAAHLLVDNLIHAPVGDILLALAAHGAPPGRGSRTPAWGVWDWPEV